MCTKLFLPNGVDIWKHHNKHTHSPIGPRSYFDISASDVRTQPWNNNDRSNKRRWLPSIFTQNPTHKLCETMQNQRYSPIKKKQCNLGIRFMPFLLLEFSPLLESCSNIYTGPTSYLIVSLLFNVLFLWYFPIFYVPVLSIVDLLISVLYTRIERCIITRPIPLLLMGCKCVLGHVLTLRLKASFKNCLVYFNYKSLS